MLIHNWSVNYCSHFKMHSLVMWVALFHLYLLIYLFYISIQVDFVVYILVQLIVNVRVRHHLDSSLYAASLFVGIEKHNTINSSQKQLKAFVCWSLKHAQRDTRIDAIYCVTSCWLSKIPAVVCNVTHTHMYNGFNGRLYFPDNN